jgi:hypothetical protein
MEVSLDCQQPLPNPARDLGKAKLKSSRKKKKDSRKINEEVKERTRLREDGKWKEGMYEAKGKTREETSEGVDGK